MIRIICDGLACTLHRAPEKITAKFDSRGWETYQSSGAYGEVYCSEPDDATHPGHLLQFSIKKDAQIRVIENFEGPMLIINISDPVVLHLDGAETLAMDSATAAFWYGRYPIFDLTLSLGDFALLCIPIAMARLAEAVVIYPGLAPFFLAAVDQKTRIIYQHNAADPALPKDNDLEFSNRELINSIGSYEASEQLDDISYWLFSKFAPDITQPEVIPATLEKAHQAAGIIDEDIQVQYSINQLCRMVGTNEFDLKRNFKRLYGTTIRSYSLSRKLNKAVELLITTDMREQDIGPIIGYKSLPDFIKVFRTKFGFAPYKLRSAARTYLNRKSFP